MIKAEVASSINCKHCFLIFLFIFEHFKMSHINTQTQSSWVKIVSALGANINNYITNIIVKTICVID